MWGCGVDLEPLSGALSDVNEEELKRKVAATVTKFAAVRGDFRYQVRYSSSVISAALQHSAPPPVHMPLQLPFSASCKGQPCLLQIPFALPLTLCVVQAAAIKSKLAANTPWLHDEVLIDLDTLLSKVLIPHVDDIQEVINPAALKSNSTLSILHNLAVDPELDHSDESTLPNRVVLDYSGLSSIALFMRKVMRFATSEARAGGEWYFSMKPFFGGQCPFGYATMCEQVTNPPVWCN